jgi:hypothetical protein
MSVKRKNIELDPEAFATAAVAQPDPVRVATGTAMPRLTATPVAPTIVHQPPASTSRQPSRAGKVQVQVWVPEDTRRRLKVLAATTGGTVEQLLVEVIDNLLKRHQAI